MSDVSDKTLSRFLPGGEVAGGRRGLGRAAQDDALLPQFRQLLYSVDALRTEERCLVLQFLGVEGGEGVSSVASGFALAAAREAELPVLYVNCAPGAMAERIESASCVRGTVVQLPAPNLRWVDLSLDEVALAGASGAGMRDEIASTRPFYAAMVLDCTGGANPANLGVARFCDGSVLVVEAECSRMTRARAARAAVERAGGQVVGAVMTRTRQRGPGWFRSFL